MEAVTDATFDQRITQHPCVVVDAWAPWCPPCLKLEPILEELAREHEGRIAFLKLNTDEETATAQRLGIMGMPTLVLFQGGRRVGQIVGLQPKPRLDAALRDVFSL